MEAQNKAIELVDKYMLKTDCLSEAKKLALNEVNDIVKSSYAYSLSDAYGRFMEDPFWGDVEQEIQNL